jgi:hypothetical protein
MQSGQHPGSVSPLPFIGIAGGDLSVVNIPICSTFPARTELSLQILAASRTNPRTLPGCRQLGNRITQFASPQKLTVLDDPNLGVKNCSRIRHRLVPQIVGDAGIIEYAPEQRNPLNIIGRIQQFHKTRCRLL